MKYLLLFLSLPCFGQVIARTVCGPGGPLSQNTGISAGEQINAQGMTSYIYLNTDCGKLVSHSNGSPIAASLPQANATTFRSGWFMDVRNGGIGTLTITPVTSTIDGAASLVLLTREGARIVSNGTNYFTVRGKGSGGGTGCTPTGSIDEVLVDDGSGGCTSLPYTIPTTIAAHQTLVATGTTAVVAKTIPDCVDTGGNHLNFTQSSDLFSCGTSGGTAGVTSVGTTGPITGGPITTTGTIACATCVVGPGSATSGHLATFNGTSGVLIQDGGAPATGTVTSVATTSPIAGGTITGTGTITCATCVVATVNPGVGVGHFAGSTQTITSSLIVNADITASTIDLTTKVTGTLPVANGGTGITSFGTGVATALGTNVSGSGAICLATGSACSSGGGGISTTQGTFAALPGTCTTGDLYFITDSQYKGRCSATNTWSFFIDGYGLVVPPPSSSWSWDNQASATIDSTNGYEYFSAPKSGAVNATWRYRTAPATPYTLTTLVRVDRSGIPPGVSATLLNSALQIIMRQSTTGKAVTFRIGSTSNITEITSDKWNSSTSFSGLYNTVGGGGGTLYDIYGPAHALMWFRMADDGTNLIWSWSVDGQHWKAFDTRLRADFLTTSGGVTGPDQIGFGAYTNGNATEIALVSWSVQ